MSSATVPTAPHRPTVCSGAMRMLWNFACGRYPNFDDDDMQRVVWYKDTHRGIQRLDNIRFPKSQKRYVFSPKFEVRINTAFDQVVMGCASPRPDDPYTWINDDLVQGYVSLHRMGYAHSFEAWHNGRLAGGCFGVQIGGYISVESMFHTISNASKAAYGQSLLILRDRGFTVVDTCGVAEHMVNYGEEWVPQWKFEEMLRTLIHQPLTIKHGLQPPLLPWRLRLALPVRRIVRAIYRRLPRRAATPTPAQDAEKLPSGEASVM